MNQDLLPWQRRQWERVMRGKAMGRLPHALLCIGPTGLGKRFFAEHLAQALLCETPATDGSPCGACRSCRVFAAGGHPDCIRVEPAEGGKRIRVDQVRELSHFLNHTTRFGGYKVAVLLCAEQMNLNAANSLLKTLEEPPAKSLLLLVTALPLQLPATVRSRCQFLVFTKPSRENAVAWLASQLAGNVDPGLLLNLADGAPLAALAYAEQERLACRLKLFRDYCKVVNGEIDPLRAVESWIKGDLQEALRWLIAWHMDMITLKMTDKPSRLLNPDLQEPLRGLAETVSACILFRRLDAATRLHALCATQVNPQLMLESFLGEVAGKEHDRPRLEV